DYYCQVWHSSGTYAVF
nr:immunoglobulin light chain junction region [Macaca mulatta]